MPSAADRRAYRGPVLFSFGFRPFFLFAAVWSAVAVPLWIAAYVWSPHAALARDWHVHEMLFGYLAAVMAGFLTTAVPNWTGRMPVMGWPLAMLVALWVAGRGVMLFAAALGPVAVVVDSAFLFVFAGVIWIEVLAGCSWRNTTVCGLLTLLAFANLAFHLRGLWPEGGPFGERAALGAMAMLIALIGGRIIPSFTLNWLKQTGDPARPAAFGALDKAGLALTAVGAAAWVAAPDSPVTGAALVLAGGACLLRLSRWCGRRTGAEAMVWILHAGYGWLGLGLVLLGASVLAPGLVPRTAGVHALTAGAAGVMTLAVMTRATLGHSGRARTAGRGTVAIYALINAAALARVCAPIHPEWQLALLTASTALWSAAFAGFALVYGPMLVGRRPAGEA
jgi:uncharacterized protein involved in response to NO